MRTRRLTAIVAGLAMLGPFSIDTYLPSFAAIATDLRIDETLVQQTLSFYLFAFAVMMLFHGTLTDSFGRRPVVLVSLAVYAVASIGAAWSPTLHWLLLFRALQGASAGAGIVVGRAVVRDLYSGADAQRVLSQVTMVFGIAPAIAPIFGGWLHSLFGWRAIFIFLALFAVALLAICWLRLPESLDRAARQPLLLGTILRNYVHALRNPRLLLYSLASGFAFSGFGLYVASAPDFVMNVLHLPETGFGWLFIPMVSGMVVGGWLSARMAHTARPGEMLARGYGCMGLAAALNLGYNLFTSTPQVPWAVLALPLYTFGSTLVLPHLTLRILDLFPYNRGLAASLQIFIQTMVFAIVSAIAPIVFGSALKPAFGLLLCMLASLACIAGVRRLRVTAP